MHRHGDPLHWALWLTLSFALIEAAGGWWAGSLALISDAGHMITDATALGLATLAAWIARHPPSLRHSYGLGRAEVLAALANALFMLALVVGITVAAIRRLQHPEPVMGGAVMAIAATGLAINLSVAWTLSRGEQTLNVRAALLHVLGDLWGSIAALLSGAVIHFTGWILIDPLLSFLICLIILYSSLNLLKEALHVLMEGVPSHLDLSEVGHALATVKGVLSVHDLHIWSLSSGKIALSAHVVLEDLALWPRLLPRIQALLKERYGIEHVTLQPEPIRQPIEEPKEALALHFEGKAEGTTNL